MNKKKTNCIIKWTFSYNCQIGQIASPTQVVIPIIISGTTTTSINGLTGSDDKTLDEGTLGTVEHEK